MGQLAQKAGSFLQLLTIKNEIEDKGHKTEGSFEKEPVPEEHPGSGHPNGQDKSGNGPQGMEDGPVIVLPHNGPE